MAKKLLRILLIVLAALLLAAVALLIWLTATEYRPEAREAIEPVLAGEGAAPGETVTLLSWNIGYGGLGAGADFVLDGGTGDGRPDSEAEFRGYYEGILDTLAGQPADVYLLQEVDSDARRSYGTDEAAELPARLGMHMAAHALNYACPFVPFPWPPIGRVHSGLLTMTALETAGGAERVALPCPFSWPLRTANLKRCLLVTRVPLPERQAELVVVNLHLEAYDDGAGKAAQTAMLLELLEAEYAAGNYVVAGGDFNQSFPGTLEDWPVRDASLWTPGALEADSLPEGWQFAFDGATPSCRLLDAPYDAGSTQHYVIDGFILSPNLACVSVETLDAGFAFSDHNPVRLTIQIKEEP